MGESLDHGAAGRIRQSGKSCIQAIHNHMVVNYPAMSSVDLGVSGFCLLGTTDVLSFGDDQQGNWSSARWWKYKGHIDQISPSAGGAFGFKERGDYIELLEHA